MNGATLLHSGIALTVTGVSKCVSVDGYAAISVLPMVASLPGVGVAFDAPLVAEACGVSAVAAVEDVDVRIYGRGLRFSSAGLAELMGFIISQAYGDGELEEALRSAMDRIGYEAAAASLLGSGVVISGTHIPLAELSGHWAAVVRLEKPVKPLERGLLELIPKPWRIIELLDWGVVGLQEISETYWRGRRKAVSLIRRASRLPGASAAVLDATGNVLAVFTERQEDAWEAVSLLSRLGDTLEAPVIA